MTTNATSPRPDNAGFVGIKTYLLHGFYMTIKDLTSIRLPEAVAVPR